MLEVQSSSPQWYVAETQPGKEQIAILNLARQSFQSLCPRFRKTRRRGRRVFEVLAPVFPGYVFVQFNRWHDPWLSINGTFGVKRLVGARPNQPQSMPENVMGALLARCEEGIVRSVVPELREGQEVRLISGPFVDQLATVERLDDRERVRVLLNVLGGAAPATVRTRDLVPA